jgi:two-component system cell cycle response regulator DivK
MAGEPVLIIEDSIPSAKLMGYLMRAHGYDPVIAPDAETALELVRSHHPVVILVDIQLPGIDGLELVRQLRIDAAWSHLLIIAVTANAMKGDRERALAAGCDDYITKPIDTRDFPRMIARHLERRGATAPEN